MDNTYDDACPCDYCGHRDSCDGWEARYCCKLCHWLGITDCDSCDPMDI